MEDSYYTNLCYGLASWRVFDECLVEEEDGDANWAESKGYRGHSSSPSVARRGSEHGEANKEDLFDYSLKALQQRGSPLIKNQEGQSPNNLTTKSLANLILSLRIQKPNVFLELHAVRARLAYPPLLLLPRSPSWPCL